MYLYIMLLHYTNYIDVLTYILILEVLNIFFNVCGGFRRENAKHIFAKLMGEEACQLDIVIMGDVN